MNLSTDADVFVGIVTVYSVAKVIRSCAAHPSKHIVCTYLHILKSSKSLLQIVQGVMPKNGP